MQHNPDDPLISIAAAATKIGVNRSTLSRQIAAGEIRSHGKKVRLSEVLADRIANIDLTRSKRRSGKIDDVASSVASVGDATIPDATNNGADADEAWVEVDGEPVPYREARRRKELALAQLRQLEFDRKSGEVASIDAVVKQVTSEYAIIRGRFLAMPGQTAPQLVGLDQHEIADVLRKTITEILENLSNPTAVAENGRKAAIN